MRTGAFGSIWNLRPAGLTRATQGPAPSIRTLNKVTRPGLAWKSYFAQSTHFPATTNPGRADQPPPRLIAATSAPSFDPPFSPGEFGAIFGQGLTNPTAI